MGDLVLLSPGLHVDRCEMIDIRIRQAEVPWRFLKSNAVIAAAIALLVALITQSWAGLNTADSEFYATLSFFGSDVTDRAIAPAYFLTRLTTIAPLYLLTQIFGPWIAFTIWRFMLLLIVSYSVMRLGNKWSLSSWQSAGLTLFISLNSAILFSLADPYPAGTTVALIFAILSLSLTLVPKARLAGVVQGLVLSLLVIAIVANNLYAGLIAVATVISVLLARKIISFNSRLFYLAIGLLLGFVAGYLIVELVSNLMFPREDWLGTVRLYTSALNQSDYTSDAWFIFKDPSMIFPMSILALSIVRLVASKCKVLVPLALSGTPIAVAFIATYVSQGPFLEFSYYQILIWPGAMLSLFLMSAPMIRKVPINLATIFISLVALCLMIVVGHTAFDFSFLAILVLISLTAICFAILNIDIEKPVLNGSMGRLLGLIVVGALFISGQIAQNSREAYRPSETIHYSNAFSANPVENMVRSSYQAETWILERTSSSDRIMTWVEMDPQDRDFGMLSMASFQLAGPNSLSNNSQPDVQDLERLETIRPSVIALYGESLESLLAYYGDLNASFKSPAPECSEFPWPNSTVKTAWVCLVRPMDFNGSNS